MTTGITDPTTGKTYTFKGLTPQRRVYENCRNGLHRDCSSAPQDLIQIFNFDFTKKVCCLCQCHFEGEVQ